MMKAALLLIGILAVAIGCQAQVVIGGVAGSAVPTCWKTDDQVSSALTVTVTVTPSGGSGHVLAAIVRGAAGNPFTLSDNSGSNTWNAVSLNNTGAVGSWGTGYVQNPVGGSYTVTGTLSGTSGSRSITVCEIAGLLTSSALDTGATTSGTCVSGTSCTTNTFSTANAHEFILVLGTVNSLTDVFTAGLIGGTGSTLISVVANDSFGEYLSVTSVQTNITAAIGGTGTVNWGYTAMAFKAP